MPTELTMHAMNHPMNCLFPLISPRALDICFNSYRCEVGSLGRESVGNSAGFFWASESHGEQHVELTVDIQGCTDHHRSLGDSAGGSAGGSRRHSREIHHPLNSLAEVTGRFTRLLSGKAEVVACP